MEQYPPQSASGEQEEAFVAMPAPEEQDCDNVREWKGLAPELLDRVLDP
jgi:hypothetical protein